MALVGAKQELGTEWEWSHFKGRLSAYAQITSPFTLIRTEEEIWAAAAAISRQRKLNTLSCDEPAAAEESQACCYEALALRDSAVHPESGELIALPFRRAAFAPVNVPLYFAMLVSPNTHICNIGWQVVNQAYNSGMNYMNRSGESPGAEREVATNFLAATSVAVMAALGTKEGLTRLLGSGPISSSRGGVFVGILARSMVPWCATTAASVVNLLLTRRDEAWGKGVAMRALPRGDAEVVAHSQKAGLEALKATAASRAILPTLGLILPPLMTEASLQCFAHNRRAALRTPIFGFALALTLTLSMPLSLAPWPWFVPMSVVELEPEVRSAAAKSSVLYYNKGL